MTTITLGARVRLVSLVTEDMLKGMTVDNQQSFNYYNYKILRAAEIHGLLSDPIIGTEGVVCSPFTDRMMTFEFVSKTTNRAIQLYLPTACFARVFEFKVGQQVLFARRATGNMTSGQMPEYKAKLYNDDADKRGLIFGKSKGVVTRVTPRNELIYVRFEDEQETYFPHQCFDLILEMIDD